MHLHRKIKKLYKKNEEGQQLVKDKIKSNLKVEYKRKKYYLLFIIFIIIVIRKVFIRLQVPLKRKLKKYNNYTSKETLQKGRNYLDKCLDMQLIRKTKFEKSKKPKISVIIPLYNNEKKIKSVIRSVQNQNMEDIEIIIINDFSKDNSSKIVEELQIDDKRIKLINNHKNLGILHSRAIGVLEAKGKYISNLDHDDLFFDEDVLEVVYEEAEENSFDIISFLSFRSTNYYIKVNKMKNISCSQIPDNLIIYQPNLTYNLMFENERFRFFDIWIWGKLILANTYKEAINLLGKERYSIFNVINEDVIALFAICLCSKSYKFIRKYGIFHYLNRNTSSQKVTREHFMLMDVFFSDILFDLSKNDNKKYAAFIIIPIKNKFYFTLKIPETKAYLAKVIKKILDCPFIKEKYKNEIRQNYSHFGLIE